MSQRIKLSVLLLCAAAATFVQCMSQPLPEFSEEEWYKKTQSPDAAALYAPHQKPDGTFFNPWLERPERHRSGSWLLRKKLTTFDKPDAAKYGNVPNDYSYLADKNFDSISFAGHASIIIKMNEQTIFTDPFFSNAALVIRKKVKIKFDYSKAPQRSVVLLSHNHYDHLDKPSVKQLAKKDAVFIVPLGLKKLITSYGAKEVHELDWWQSVTLDSIEYTLLPAQHWSRRIGQKAGATLWGGYLIQGSKTIYFSGDTGYFIGFKEFAKHWDIDYAILGAGANEPRWFMHYAHMNVEEFFRAARDLNAASSIPMHFGIIKLSDEPILYPLFEVDNAIKQNPRLAETVRPLRVGEFLHLQ